jgi:hypothetical protein
MPTLNFESNVSKEAKECKQITVPKEIKKLIKDYEKSKWLTGC